jgi:hydroxymethylbilane synthase
VSAAILDPPLRIATRKSQLALWQAEHVASLLRREHPGLEVQLVPMTTKGDRIQDRSLAAIGGKGLFIKELETALEDGHADLAVHSMKDVPGELPEGLMIAAVLPRADARDALVTPADRRLEDDLRGALVTPALSLEDDARGALVTPALSLEELPRGARLGTSSLRRQAQVLAARPDLRIEPQRGNVDTRLRRLDAGELDAIILACAGLLRLGLESRIAARLDPRVLLPAVSQGIIGVECRTSDLRSRDVLRVLDDAATRTAMEAERAFARRLGGSCKSPIAAHAHIDADRLTLDGLVAEPDGSRLLRDSISGSASRAQSLGEELAERVLASGAGDLLQRLHTA